MDKLITLHDTPIGVYIYIQCRPTRIIEAEWRRRSIVEMSASSVN